MVASRRSQPGGLGKHAGRSMTRTMQRRKLKPRRTLLAETGSRGWRLGDKTRKPGIAAPAQREGGRGPTGVRSTARMDSAAGKVGKVSRVAEALPHSEGAAYKRQGVKSPRAGETGGWGRSTRRWTETTELGPEPRTPGVGRLRASRTAARGSAARPGHSARPECPWWKRAKGRCKPGVEA